MSGARNKNAGEGFVPYGSVLDGPPSVDVLPVEEISPPDRTEQGVKELRKAATTMSRRATDGIDPNDPQTRLLSQTIMLEEAGASSYSRSVLVLGAALMIAAVAWASVTNLDEVASGSGQVVPEGAVKVVQHLEGGIVQQILVKDGDKVTKGQVVMRLKGDQVQSEKTRLEARMAALRLRAARLHAFVMGTALPKVDPKATGAEAVRAREELQILRLQDKARRLQRSVLAAQVSQSEARLKSLKASQASLREQFSAVEESYKLRQVGVAKGVVARSLYLQTRREYERSRGELNEAQIKIQRADKARVEAQAKLAEHDARVRSDALTERGKVTAEMAQVRAQLSKVREQVARLAIRAPASGRVKGLKVRTIGAVIASGGAPLMEIVPAGARLVVEARISTRDIGHIRAGQTVKLKVDTYDFARFGALIGTITTVSATTFATKEGRPYYKATVVVDRSKSAPRASGLRLAPGMTVTAEVVTGRKSLLSYLLKPVYAALDSGMTER